MDLECPSVTRGPMDREEKSGFIGLASRQSRSDSEHIHVGGTAMHIISELPPFLEIPHGCLHGYRLVISTRRGKHRSMENKSQMSLKHLSIQKVRERNNRSSH